MASKVRLADGREITVALPGKKVIDMLEQAATGSESFTRFNTATSTRVWINPTHVAAVEDRPDLD
ncbi:hypothetical protein [Capillimicrobium parvum]|jgi:hypothetical protein|uniref:Uncharacterized protein n=1 Tax=Capillimicrobium parvum TaxID=2884022 RepID=A0A9E6Y2H6_9ACTN|nr:hypothetical protein [Capillimicrobium parvum]UGS38825.1 hypothetical protein DSM104329_05255 [Capillimicrobium parvum]